MFCSFKEGQSYYFFKLATFGNSQNSEKGIEEKEKEKGIRRQQTQTTSNWILSHPI